MWGLLITTIATSAADSLNPFAITQQFVLQGLVKRPKDIWYFIIPTGVTNLIGGFFAYFGIVAIIDSFLSELMAIYGQALATIELIIGIAFLIAAGLLVQNNKIEELKKQIQFYKNEQNIDDETKAVSKIKSVTPIALVIMGVGATISELATALPYFAFLAILFKYELTLIPLTIILVIYNVIYTSPLAVLYFIYIKAQNKFERIYSVMKTQVSKWSNILAPTLVGAIGVFLVYHSISLLLMLI